jgi:hypothetical protein
VYGSQIKEWVCPKREKQRAELLITDNAKRKQLKSRKYIIGVIEQYPNLYLLGY